MTRRAWLPALAIVAVATALSAQQPLRVAESVDLNRYTGKWYEIARIPNRFQNRCARDVVAQYSLRPDGRLDVVNQCRNEDGGIVQARGVARKGKSGNSAVLQVRFAPAILSFLPNVWGDYWIIAIGPDYTWSVVGTPSRDYLWILSRTPAMTTSGYAQAIEIAKGNGFDASRIVKTPQKN